MVMTVGHQAQAASFQRTSWTDKISDIDLKLKKGDAYSFTHDITDDGFDVSHDFVRRFKVGLKLRDDSRKNDAVSDRPEWVYIDLPGRRGDRKYEVDAGKYFGRKSVKGVLQLNKSGELNVTVASLKGDFKILGSHLTAYGKEKVKDVPEPASLMGLVMVGAVGVGRIVKRKK